MKPQLIGLIGPAGCGKDTVSAMLNIHHGYATVAFANPIRAMVQALFDCAGVSHAYMTDRALKEATIPKLNASYRHIAQTLGTEWGQQCMGRGFWVLMIEAELKRLRYLYPGAPIVISDCRFAHECNWVKAQGGQIWRIDRPGIEPVRAHISESEGQQITADQTISNHGSLTDLAQAVAAAINASHTEPAAS